jgi:four helix bundle protein
VTFREFEEIIAWQKARVLAVQVYTSFDGSRDFGFKDQIQRASVSIMNNIAEGFERQTDREFHQSLYIAKGSCAEVRSMLYLASDLRMLDEKDLNRLSEMAIETSKILSGLIKVLKNP